MTDARGLVVWITGPDPVRLDAVADAVLERLAARGLAVEALRRRTLAPCADPAGAAVVAATLLARHGVTAVVALPAMRAERDAARADAGRFIEVDLPGDTSAPGHEPAERAEVEIAPGDEADAAARVVHTLELLGHVEAGDARYSPDEERAVIHRLKAFGYL